MPPVISITSLWLYIGANKTTKKSEKATSTTGEEGKTLLQSAVSYTIGVDKRDNRFDPREGYNAEITKPIQVSAVIQPS